MKALAQTVKYVSGNAAARTASYPCGHGRHCASGATQYSA